MRVRTTPEGALLCLGAALVPGMLQAPDQRGIHEMPKKDGAGPGTKLREGPPAGWPPSALIDKIADDGGRSVWPMVKVFRVADGKRKGKQLGEFPSDDLPRCEEIIREAWGGGAYDLAAYMAGHGFGPQCRLEVDGPILPDAAAQPAGPAGYPGYPTHPYPPPPGYPPHYAAGGMWPPYMHAMPPQPTPAERAAENALRMELAELRAMVKVQSEAKNNDLLGVLIAKMLDDNSERRMSMADVEGRALERGLELAERIADRQNDALGVEVVKTLGSLGDRFLDKRGALPQLPAAPQGDYERLAVLLTRSIQESWRPSTTVDVLVITFGQPRVLAFLSKIDETLNLCAQSSAEFKSIVEDERRAGPWFNEMTAYLSAQEQAATTEHQAESSEKDVTESA